MNRKDVEERVSLVFSTILKAETPNITRENTPRWDSLKHLQIMFAVEEEFGVEFSPDELKKLDSAEKIIALVCERKCKNEA